MGRLVVVEGLDGAGKRTLVDDLTGRLRARDASVATVAFPRYDADVHAALARDALYGRMGDLAASVHGMATLFALDRSAAATELSALARRHDVVLCDRYVASNAAYGAARLHEDAEGAFVSWVHALEVDRLAVPLPDLQLLLRVPVRVAAQRAEDRAVSEPGRARDAYESDAPLQERCAAVYEQLAAREWLAPWRVVDGADGAGGDADITAALLGE